MACSQKRLRDHLQEQQDPFVLEIYLLERRIMLNKIPIGQGSCKLNCKVSRGRNNILKLIFDKFITTSQRQKGSNRRSKTHQHEPTSSDCLENQGSCLARISPGLKESTFKEKQISADINLQLGSKEDCKQLSMSSVLNKVSSPNKVSFFQQKEDASISSTMLTTNGEEGDILSVILRELVVRSLVEKQSTSCGFKEPQDINGLGFSQHLKKKNALQSNKKLFHDCMREAIELQGMKLRRKKHAKEFISLQELAKIICDQISSWSQENTGHKIFDDSNAKEDWNYLQVEKRKIVAEIEDAITDSIIQETIDLFIEQNSVILNDISSTIY